MTKKMVWRSAWVDSSEIKGQSLSDVLAVLFKLAEQYGNDASLTISADSDGDIDFEVEWQQLESDAEYASRLRRERAAEEKLKAMEEAKRQAALKVEQDERALYEKLKAKYGE